MDKGYSVRKIRQALTPNIYMAKHKVFRKLADIAELCMHFEREFILCSENFSEYSTKKIHLNKSVLIFLFIYNKVLTFTTVSGTD